MGSACGTAASPKHVSGKEQEGIPPPTTAPGSGAMDKEPVPSKSAKEPVQSKSSKSRVLTRNSTGAGGGSIVAIHLKRLPNGTYQKSTLRGMERTESGRSVSQIFRERMRTRHMTIMRSEEEMMSPKSKQLNMLQKFEKVSFPVPHILPSSAYECGGDSLQRKNSTRAILCMRCVPRWWGSCVGCRCRLRHTSTNI